MVRQRVAVVVFYKSGQTGEGHLTVQIHAFVLKTHKYFSQSIPRPVHGPRDSRELTLKSTKILPHIWKLGQCLFFKVKKMEIP